jgi:hypothetical protein
MSVTTVDARWYFEGPDYEVGLFGDLIVHECDDNTEDARGHVAEAEVAEVRQRTDGSLVTITTVFRCPVDGATTEVVDQHPAEHFESGPGGDE